MLNKQLGLACALSALVFSGPHAQAETADSDLQIQQQLEGIYQLRPGYIVVHGDWGGTVAVLREVAATKRGAVGALPDRFAVCSVDLKTRKVTAVTVPGIKQVTHLGNDGANRVATGVADDGSWHVMREKESKWEELPLPEEVQKAKFRRLIRSDGPLAIGIAEAVFRWSDGKWNKTQLPAFNARLYECIVVEGDGLLIGSTFYLGWWNQGDTVDGGFVAIDLDAKSPAWRSIYGVDDPQQGIRENRAVVVLAAAPKGQILLDAESDLDHAKIYHFDGQRWTKRIDIAAKLPDDPVGLGNWGNVVTQEDAGDLRLDKHGVLHLLGPKGIFVLRENKLVRLVPGPIFRPNSLYIDDDGSFLVGTTMAGLVQFEKVEGGYKMHRLAFP